MITSSFIFNFIYFISLSHSLSLSLLLSFGEFSFLNGHVMCQLVSDWLLDADIFLMSCQRHKKRNVCFLFVCFFFCLLLFYFFLQVSVRYIHIFSVVCCFAPVPLNSVIGKKTTLYLSITLY